MYPIIDKEKTGKRIRELMEERQISVKDVQECLSLESVQSVYYWISGRNIPTIDNLYALSELLQVPMDAMICGNRTSRFDGTGWKQAASLESSVWLWQPAEQRAS